MRILFITDGGFEMGMGHVYRSIALANELKKFNVKDIIFITKSDEYVIKKIKESNFKVIKCNDNNDILDSIKNIKPDVVIIDDLGVEEDFAKNIRDFCKKLVFFDNTNPSSNKYADVVVNAIIESKLKNRKYFDEENKTLYFYGPKYLILRDEFYRVKKEISRKDRGGNVENILIAFGGSDPSNLTCKVLEKLLSKDKNFNIDIVLGPKFQYDRELNNLLKKYGKIESDKIRIYKNINNMAELMKNVDLVITSPGMTMFEALFLGVPVVVLYQNELQMKYYYKILDKYKNKFLHINNINEFCVDSVDLEIGNGVYEIILEIVGGDYMKNELLNIHTDKLKKKYENHFEKHDPNSPEAVHWRGKEKTWLRFKILTEMDDLNSMRILDFGCGNALLADYLKEQNIKCEYHGWDISEKMIEVAKKRHPDAKFKIIDILKDDEVNNYHNFFDYILISGVFNLKIDAKSETHEAWIKEMLLKLYNLCRKGIAVNFLTEYVDWKEKDLYYCKISEMMNFCVSNLSRWFVIRHDYQLYEFTIYIYKEPKVRL
jgi:UDP-2,4-diacetamido-2,4,6-trideoxy-beta-L-altropyranose hydrolase